MFLQKKQMNGVNVNITISFEVKIVSTEVNKYKRINSKNWLFFAIDVDLLAKYLNNPVSSKKIDIQVIEKKSTNILSGLIDESLLISSATSFIGARLKIIRASAPTRATIQ